MKKRRAHQVWVLVHCEFSKVGKETFIDEAVFAAFSSLRMVERYIRSGTVEPFSWWKAQFFNIDDVQEKETVSYYNYKGKAIKRPPFKQAKRRMKDDRE